MLTQLSVIVDSAKRVLKEQGKEDTVSQTQTYLESKNQEVGP